MFYGQPMAKKGPGGPKRRGGRVAVRTRRARCERCGDGVQHCHGYQRDHDDDSMSCTLGDKCVGVALPHEGWGPCRDFGPCWYCESGANAIWVHE